MALITEENDANNNLSLLSSSQIPVEDKKVEIKQLQDGSTRYNIIYKAYYTELPKIVAINFDPMDEEHAYASIEFRPSNKLDSQTIDLSLIEKAFIEYKIQYEEQLVTISDNAANLTPIKFRTIQVKKDSVVKALAYLYHKYNEISPDASFLLLEAIKFIAKLQLSQKEPKWERDLARHLAIIEEVIKENGPSAMQIEDCNLEEYSLVKYMQISECEENKRTKFDQFISLYNSEDLFNNINIIRIENEVQHILKEYSPIAMYYREKIKEAEFIFNTTERCKEFLRSKYNLSEELEQELESFALAIHSGISELSNKDAGVIRQFANHGKGLLKHIIPFENLEALGKNVKDVATIVGSSLKLLKPLVDIAKSVPQVAASINFLEYSIAGASMLSSSIGITHRNSIQEFNITELLKEFSCKVTLCNALYFYQLDENGKQDLSSFYSQYIYLSLKEGIEDDEIQHINTSYRLLDSLSNMEYINRLNLTLHMQNKLSLQSGESINISEYLSHYNQLECYNSLKSDIIGSTAD